VFGATAAYQFDAFTLSSVTSYLDYRTLSTNDANVLLVPSRIVSEIDSDVLTEELTLLSTGTENWRWSLGAIYRESEARALQGLPDIGVPRQSDYTDLSKSYAVFGELTRVFMDGKLELTGGLRYFNDENSVQDHIRVNVRRESEFEATTPRVVLTWLPSDTVTMYASYSEGFRSGLNQTPTITRTAPSIPPADADTLTNYELGAKTRLFSRRLAIETAVYYMDWQDVQQDLGVLVGASTFQAIVNAESASGIGVDLGLALDATDQLQFGLSASWNDLAMDADLYSRGVLLYAEGDRLNRSPELTLGATVDYQTPLGSSELEGLFSLSAYHTSAIAWRSQLGIPVTVSEGDSITLGRATFAIDSPQGWRASLFVDNFTNEDGITSAPPFGVPDWNQRLRPRTLGVQVEYMF
jgi:outer membrane receptor protein involved in Fe transport